MNRGDAHRHRRAFAIGPAADAEGDPRPPQSAAAGGGQPPVRAAAHPRRRGQRQDARPRASRRVSDRHQLQAMADRGGHVHEQGRQRDARRIAGLIGEEGAREATIGTFHAICARILRRDGEAIGLTRSFTIYDRADQVALVKTVLKNLDLDEKRFGPARDAGLDRAAQGRAGRRRHRQQAGGELLRRDGREGVRRLPAAADRGRRRRLRRPAHARRLPVRAASRRCWSATRRAGSRSSSTSTRTRTAPSTSSAASWPPSTRTCPWSATTTSRSTPGAARTCATSSTSRPITPTPRSSSSSRTTDRPRRSSTRPTRSCPATRAARTRSCGPIAAPARRSRCSTPTTSTRRRSSSRGRSRSSSAALAAAGWPPS